MTFSFSRYTSKIEVYFPGSVLLQVVATIPFLQGNMLDKQFEWLVVLLVCPDCSMVISVWLSIGSQRLLPVETNICQTSL